MPGDAQRTREPSGSTTYSLENLSDPPAPTAIRGIIPTVLTPFDEEERVDDVALRAQVEYLVDAGVHGLMIMGSFGECPYLNDDDREIVIRSCIDAIGASGRPVPTIVGIAAPSTFAAAEQLRQAQRLGATAAMVTLPQYFRLQFDDVKRHFVRLAEMNLLPILYYHYPAVTGLKLTAAQVAELLSIPNIIGIKETTFDLHAVRQHIGLTQDRKAVYLTGSELVFTQFMELGGHGVVGAASLVMPRTALKLYDTYLAGDRSRAREVQALLFETMPLARDMRAPVSLVRAAFLLAIRQGVNIPLDVMPTQARLKAALAYRGIPIKPFARSPLPTYSAHDEEAVAQAMERIMKIESHTGSAH